MEGFPSSKCVPDKSGFEISQAEGSLLDELFQPSACYMEERWLWHRSHLGHALPRRKKRARMHGEPRRSGKAGEIWCPPVFTVSSCPWPATAHAAPRNLAVLGAQSLTSRNLSQGAQHLPRG